MKTLRHAVSFLCLLLLATTAAFAQNSAGSLSGAVTDSNGSAVAKAKVIAKQDSTGRQFETITTSEGLFAFANLDVGSYTLTVEQSGFKKLTWPNVVIAISNRTVADLKLEVGDVNQTVTITAEAPAIQTATTEVGVSFAPKLFVDAPIFAGGLRNPEAFIGFQPGVVNGAGAEGGISGGQRRSKEILIDGANATNPESGGVAFNGLPSVESLGEFKLINNTFAAEYGRTGGGIESFVTKSGGRDFHGNVFNFHTSSALNANAWAFKANPGTEIRKIPLHGNNYGFALGGPIYLPKKVFGPLGGYNEDRTRSFFLFSLDNFRRTDSSSGFRTLPTARQRQGDFSELLPGRLIYDPVTGQPFPGNIIPQNRFSAVSRNIMPLIPATTAPGLLNNYLATTTTSQKQDSWSVKINHNITDKHLLNFFYTKQDLGILQNGPLPQPLQGANTTSESSNRPIFARVNYDWIFTPTLNLHLTYGATRLRQYFDNDQVGQDWPQKLGLRGVSEGDTNSFPVVQFLTNGYTNYADTNGNKTKGAQFNFTDHIRGDVSWVKGNFNWKFGADHRWMRTTGEKLSTGGFDDAGVQGVFQFAQNQTASATNVSGSGDAFASFLLGLVDGATRTFNASASAAKFGYNAWYAQTDWRIRPNLTLNLGFRYELPIGRSTDPTSFTSFDPNITDPRSGLKGALAYLGDCAGCIDQDRFAETDFSSVGPRLGLAWAVNQKTVVRLGYGMYYAAGNGLTGGFCLRCQTGYSTTAGLSRPSTTGAALQWDNGFTPSSTFLAPPVINPSAGNTADDIWYMTPDSGKAPRFQNWSVSIQRELPWKLVAEVAYIGNRGTRLSSSHQPLNHLDPKFYALGSLLNLEIDNPQVVAAGYKSPYPNFIADWRNPISNTGATLARALRPYPHINGPINNHYNPIGKSWYDSLQLKLDRRFGWVTMEGNYTWSKALTDASGTQTSGDAANRNAKTDRPYDPRAIELSKSLQYIDIPHIANIIAVVDLPFGKGQRFPINNAVLDRILGGWSVSFTGNYTSGALILLNAPYTYPQWGFEYGRKRVNLVNGKPIRTGISRQDLDPRDLTKRWLTTDFFSIPGAFELGSAPIYINELRDANVYSDNMGFIKRTRITETVNIEIRAEFFNIFNRTNFGVTAGLATAPRPNVVDTNPVTGRFGVANGPRSGPRTGQVAAKINF
ncbi:MAG: carboxypeptidase regulatory-like domain-containing protein [Blastocatellia bacterium]